MTLAEYMNPDHFPLTTRRGASPSYQLAIDAFEYGQMCEYLRRCGGLDEGQKARRAELETKMKHHARLAAEVRARDREERAPRGREGDATSPTDTITAPAHVLDGSHFSNRRPSLRGGTAMLPIRTILHPTDFSEPAQHAFAAACALARDHGSRLVVLYVRAPTVVAYGEMGPIVPDPVWTPADVKAALSELHLPDPGVEVEYRVAEGDPAAEIIRLASEVKANLIVMSTHGRTGLGRLLMGSVAEVVLRRAPCPVLTLKVPLFAGAKEPLVPVGEPASI